MPSPFPGMDPYLEAPNIWEDFHHALTFQLRAQLAPLLRPKYIAAVEPKGTYDDEIIVAEPRRIKPDIGVYFLSREHQRSQLEIWPLSFSEPLPILPVPLRAPDADVPLDLGKGIRELYDIAAYDLRIDCAAPPPKPPLAPQDAAYVDALLREKKLR